MRKWAYISVEGGGPDIAAATYPDLAPEAQADGPLPTSEEVLVTEKASKQSDGKPEEPPLPVPSPPPRRAAQRPLPPEAHQPWAPTAFLHSFLPCHPPIARRPLSSSVACTHRHNSTS